MGRPKLLMPWGALSVIERVIAAWQASRVDRIVAVVRTDDDALADVCRKAGILVVRPAINPPEMKDSVLLGLDFVRQQFSPSAEDAWLVAPCDLPNLRPMVIDAVLSAASAAPAQRSIWVPTHGEKRGHPVLFPWPLAGDVGWLGPHEGLNALLARHPHRTLELGSAAVAEDVDTPEEYEQLSARHEQQP